MSDHLVELGIGAIVNLGSEFSRLFDEWELAWAAAGLSPAMVAPTESEELTGLSQVLRGFLENRGIDWARITWTVDTADKFGFAIIVSPVGRWPIAHRQALREEFYRFVSSNAIANVGFVLITVGDTPAPGPGAMITII